MTQPNKFKFKFKKQVGGISEVASSVLSNQKVLVSNQKRDKAEHQRGLSIISLEDRVSGGSID